VAQGCTDGRYLGLPYEIYWSTKDAGRGLYTQPLSIESNVELFLVVPGPNSNFDLLTLVFLNARPTARAFGLRHMGQRGKTMLERIFRLNSFTFAILCENEQRTAVTIPANALVTVLVGDVDGDGLDQDSLPTEGSRNAWGRRSESRRTYLAIGIVRIVFGSFNFG